MQAVSCVQECLFRSLVWYCSLDVSSQSYSAMQVVSALGLVVYTLGIPLSFFLVLYKNRAELWNPSSTVALKYAWLYQDLSPNRWWFFPVSMLEKMCYAVIVVFLSGHVFEQYTLEILLTVASVVMLAVLRPYTGWFQTLLLASRLVIFLTLFGAIALGHENCNALTEHSFRLNDYALGVILIVLNLTVVLLPLGYLLSLWRQNPGCLRQCCCRNQGNSISLRALRKSLLQTPHMEEVVHSGALAVPADKERRGVADNSHDQQSVADV